MVKIYFPPEMIQKRNYVDSLLAEVSDGETSASRELCGKFQTNKKTVTLRTLRKNGTATKHNSNNWIIWLFSFGHFLSRF